MNEILLICNACCEALLASWSMMQPLSGSSAELAATLQFQFDEEECVVTVLRSVRNSLLLRSTCLTAACAWTEESIAHTDPCESRRPSPRFFSAQMLSGTESIGCDARTGTLNWNQEGTLRDPSEMETSEFFVLLSSRKYTRSSFFDREGFNEARSSRFLLVDCATFFGVRSASRRSLLRDQSILATVLWRRKISADIKGGSVQVATREDQ
ncbi:hypothetical protein EI94DRAFT_1699038 [Lactarius quietus]|nr:hypothetical protein EI94DRAFT_1699038 [Lactarius quietus]